MDKYLTDFNDKIDKYCEDYKKIEMPSKIKIEEQEKNFFEFVNKEKIEIFPLKYSISIKFFENFPDLILLYSDERYSPRNCTLSQFCGDNGLVFEKSTKKIISFSLQRFLSYPVLVYPEKCPDQHNHFGWGKIKTVKVN